jgi:hypothetical protein
MGKIHGGVSIGGAILERANEVLELISKARDLLEKISKKNPDWSTCRAALWGSGESMGTRGK